MKSISLKVFMSLIPLFIIMMAVSYGGDRIVLKAAHVLAADHPYNMGMFRMKELLEKRTNGRISMDIFPSSQLGNERELTEGIQLGTVDIALAAASVVANFNKHLVVYDLPFLFNNRKHAYAFLDGELGKVYLDELSSNNIIGLGYWETGFSKLCNRLRPVSKPSDVAKLNIRTMESQPYMLYFSQLGANPVPLGWGDIYTSLQNGTIDGLTNPITAIYTSRLHDYAKYLSRDDSHYCPILLIMNPSIYNSLSAQEQQIIKESEEEARHYEREQVVLGEERLYAAFVKEGGTIVDVDRKAFMEHPAVTSVYESIVPAIIPQNVIDMCKSLDK
jgi:tripartite ATP-independent transporter DctP family solute receptor